MHAVLKLALAGLALASLASWLGELVEPADTLSHLRLHFAAAAAVLMVAHVAARQSWAAVLAALLIAANLAGSLIYPHREPSAAPLAQGERALTVVAFNTRWTADNAQALVAFLDRTRPDIVMLEELTPAKRAAVLPRVAYYLPWQVECSDDLFCRVGLLSAHPWQDARAGRHGDVDDDDAVAMAYADFGARLGGLSVVGVHLSRPWPWWEAHRKQVRSLIPFAKARPGPTLMLGDFNATPWSRSIRRIGSETGLRPAGWYKPGWPLRLSRLWEMPLPPQLQIDHVLLPEGIRLLSVEHGPDLGSDHLPIVARIAVRPR